MITKIHTVAVVVSDAKRATAWYTERLGFELKKESESHWVVVGPRGSELGLHLCETGTMSGPVDAGNSGVLLLVDDLEKTARELKGRGVEFTKEITKAEWGTFAMIKDPDGNEFWLMPNF